MVVVLFSKECHRCHPSEGVSEILREREREGGRKRGKERESGIIIICWQGGGEGSTERVACCFTEHAKILRKRKG
jgi:hypothetical protein